MLATSLASARVLYVSPAAAQAGDGSEAAPFANPADAVEASEAGDTILLRHGAYRVSAPLYLDRSGITLTTLSGETATLAGASTSADQLPAVLIVGANDITVSGLRVQGGFYGIKIEPAAGDSIQRIRLRELVIGGTGADCIKSTNADRMTIESCNIGPSGSVQKDNAEGIDVIGSLGITIRNCVVHEVATNGIYLKGGTRNGLIEDCVVRKAGDGGILLGQDTDPQYMRGRSKYEAISCAARNNLVVDTGTAGLAAYSAQNVRFENNTLVDVAQRGQAGLWVVTNSREVPTEGASFTGNIVCVGASGRPVAFLKDPGDVPGFDRNVYFSRSGKVLFRQEITSLNRAEEWEFSAWQKAMKVDLQSFIADPELDEQNGFRPRDSSRAKGYGRLSTTRPTGHGPAAGPATAPTGR